MAKYRKKAIRVTAIRIDAPQYVTTLEGVSEGKPGDYLVTGIDNEQWFVIPENFHNSYTHIRGNIYERKPQILEAVQIDEPEIVSAPTGEIKGDKGDYKVTGTKGEQWFVKPDIFKKTYERVSKSMEGNNLQKAIDQIGMMGVQKYLPKGMKLHPCDLHGHFLSHYSDSNPTCPLCIKHDPQAEGTTATEMELFIDLRDAGIAPRVPNSTRGM